MKVLKAKLTELIAKLRAVLEGPQQLKPIPLRTEREVERWSNEGGH